MVSLTGEPVGKISKQWSGLAREIFTDADFFGITFPMDLDVRMKAVLLGATFLIVSIRPDPIIRAFQFHICVYTIHICYIILNSGIALSFIV